MSGQAVEALERLAQLWSRERATTRDRFLAERRALPLNERVARGLALKDLRVDEVDAAPGDRLLIWVRPRAGETRDVRIGPGDPVQLWWNEPDEVEALRGTVSRAGRRGLAVMIDGELPEAFESEGFRLDVDAPQATFDRGARAIERFRRAEPSSPLGRLREVFWGERRPEFDPPASPRPFDTELNEVQLEAVGRALAGREVCLIHGPPGTGKTRTLVEVIRQAVARGERVLAAAASNTAVDNMAERLVDSGLRVVRLGHPARLSEAMRAHGLDAQLEQTEIYTLARRWLAEAHQIRTRVGKRWRRRQIGWRERRAELAQARALTRDARVQLRRAQDAIIDRASVVLSTAAGADSVLLGDRRFDRVVLDEATQAVDPVALVALARGGRAVLAGDPRQLPPTIIDEAAEREGLGSTCFERLYAREGEEAARMLVVQYRMHEQLMAFPSSTEYGGKLRASPLVATHRLEDLPGVAADPLRPGPLVFLDTAGTGWGETRTLDDPSTANPDQGGRVAAEVGRLLGRGVAPSDLAVITPYYAQVRLLRDLLGPPCAEGLEVGTVDGFQGREKEAVVVDLVRSNESGDLGFLTDTRRMNVALTRARRFLLVVGDSATLGRHPYYQRFFESVEAAGAWLSAWSDDAPPWE